MRTAMPVALCFLIGACATFGGGGTDPYGVYDIVSMNGEDWAGNDDLNAWYELRPDGTSTVTFDVAQLPDLEPAHTDFSLDNIESGCFPFSATPEEGGVWAGSICGDVFTIEGHDAEGVQVVMILHKRR